MIPGLGFRIAFRRQPQQGLRTGEPADHPAAIPEGHLTSVFITDCFCPIRKFRELFLIKYQLLQFLLVFRRGGKILLHKIQQSVFLNNLPVNFCDGLPRHRQHLHQQGSRINTILTMNMTPDGHAAGGFAADDRVGGSHFSGDMFKTYGNLIAFFSECPCHPVQQMGCGNITDTGSRPAPVLQQIVIENHQQHIGMEVISLIVHHTQPVCVTVGGNAQMTAVFRHINRQQPLGFRTGGRHSAAEKGIVLFPDHIHITPASQKNGPQTVVADTVHGINGNPQTAFLDFFHIHQGQNAVDILVKGIAFPDDARLQGFPVGNAFHICSSQFLNFRFNFLSHHLVCIPATSGKHLDTVVNGRIMAGGDGHAVRQFHLLHRKHHQWGGNAAVDYKRPESVACQHLRRPVHGFLGQKPPVIAQTNFLAPMAFLQHQIAQSRCQQPDILFCKAIGDDGTPAAGTESDHLSHPYSLIYQFTVYHNPPFFSNGKWHTKKAPHCGHI